MAQLDITPKANELWKGLGGHFNDFTQMICEFIDNCISNFHSNNVLNRSVYIDINENKKKIKVRIEDNGTGIRNIENTLRIGDLSPRETPLNEHGFGLKHALAFANPKNDSWAIYTRTKEISKDGKYYLLKAPYSFKMNAELKSDNTRWPGQFNSTGTIIEFECSKELFDTVQAGIKGKAGFIRCLDYLCEDIGYIYSGVIEKGKVNIHIASSLNNYTNVVQSVKPVWVGFYKPERGEIQHDLGGGKLGIEYVFGEIKNSNYMRYYKKALSKSGAEIRINGRLLSSNIFSMIWNVDNHPRFNHFLCIINLVSNERNALPRTNTSKNNITSSDTKFLSLLNWIRSVHPSPPAELSSAVSERELVEKLVKAKNIHIRNKDKRIETNFEVFKKLDSPVRVDLYVFDGKEIILYEAKKDKADVQSLYQLIMYWDGAVYDGLCPNEAVLIASSFSEGLNEIIEYFNEKTDQNGEHYNIVRKTWKEEGVDFPR